MRRLAQWTVEGELFWVGLAETITEKRLAFELRYREFCTPNKKGICRLPPENYPDGLEHDQFDKHSWQLLAFKGEQSGEDVQQAIGTVRMIQCQYGCFLERHAFGPLPNNQNGLLGSWKLDDPSRPDSAVPFRIPRSFHGETIDRNYTVEIARWIGNSVRLESGRRVLVSMLLLEGCLEYSRDMQIHHWISGAELSSVQNLRKKGWPLHSLLPKPVMYYNHPVDVIINVVDDHEITQSIETVQMGT